MTDASGETKPSAKRSTLLRRLAYIGIPILAGIVVLAFGLRAQQPGQSLVAEWNRTIQNLGIEPVFPPEEELSVGDILAVVVRDRRPEHDDPENLALLNRSVKLGHIKLDDYIERIYGEEYVFPDTKERPTEDGKIWEQNAAAGDIFVHPGIRNRLALTAFPGFSIHHQQDLNLTAAFRGLFGLSTSTDQDVEFSIPFVETYGVLSTVALTQLEKYCSDHSECDDNFVRQHLAFVSPGVMQVDDSVSATGQGGYLVDVAVELVNRVYLVRAIDEKINNQQSRTTSASLAPPPFAGGDSSGGAAQPAAGSPGQPVAGKADSNYGAGSSLKQIFERPLVIGYRSVKRVLTNGGGVGPAPNLAPGQAPAPNLAPGEAPANLAPGQGPAANLAPGQGPAEK